MASSDNSDTLDDCERQCAYDCSDGSAPEETVVDMNEILENILYQQKETNKVSLKIKNSLTFTTTL